MKAIKIADLRIAWLIPSVELGAYWQPVLEEFTQVFKNTIFYTGLVWPGFNPEAPGAKAIKLVGEMKSVELTKTEGYSRRLMVVSTGIVGELWQFKPDVVLAQAFSLWTLLAVLLKPVMGWRLIIIYDGSSPNSDFRDSKVRSWFRQFMAKFADAFIPNSYGAKDYLMQELGAKEDIVFTKMYLVPDAQTLQQSLNGTELPNIQGKRPIFLYVGRITPRKGIKSLLEACSILQTQGYRDYTLVAIGTGDQRAELEAFIQEKNLENQVQWLGFIEYGRLGAYFQQADVFVFPTFEDIWGMVPLEAMVFGKAVLCSKWAGAAEAIVVGENGYIFDPYNPSELAEMMRRFLDNPSLISSMGAKSQEIMAQNTPKTAAQSFVEVILTVVDKGASV